MKTSIFNFNRVGLLFQRYFTENFNMERIYWGIMVIVFMFIRNIPIAMNFAIIIAGAFYAARFFKEIHSRSNGIACFMVPATQLEKLTVGIVMTTFYYFAMMMIAYILGNLLGAFLNNMLANTNLIFFNIFKYSSLQWTLFTNPLGKFFNGQPVEDYKGLVTIFKIFVINQSIFLLGSIYFKNNQAFKTFFTVVVIQILLVIFLSVEMRLIFGEFGININSTNFNSMHGFGETLGGILHTLVYLLPPFFWIVTYFRLTEKQV